MDSDIVITTIKDILNNYKQIINNRYAGDWEFNEFKNFLKNTRCYLILLNCFLFLIGSITFFYEFWQLVYWDTFAIFKLTAGLGLVVFSCYNLSQLLKTCKYLKLVHSIDCLKGRLEWDEWQFLDLIFCAPKNITSKSKLLFKQPYSKYFVYYLCEYPNGYLRWLGLNNQGIEAKNDSELSTSKNVEKHLKTPISILMRHSFVKSVVRDKKGEITRIEFYDLSPSRVVAIRLRASVEGDSVIFPKIGIDTK